MTVPAARAVGLLDSLAALDEVEWAGREPRPVRPPASPDLRATQGYLGAAPAGVAASAAAGVPGADGGRVGVVDIEYSWHRDHEDVTQLAVPSALIANGTPWDPFGDAEHGTAATSLLAGDDNAFGVTGLVPRAALRVVNAAGAERGWDLANAIDLARARSAPGDVIVIEQQTTGPDGALVPVEWVPSVHDAITYATAAGIVVVEAAGNGGADLDASLYGSRFPQGRPDSGAIVVGAGGAPGCSTPRARLAFSNHGSRLDLQGWGECVTAAGYGSGWAGARPASWYTRTFGGTSSAAALVAGAAAAWSSAYEARHGRPPAPAEVRRALVETGTPQDTTSPGVTAGRIGPLPDLAAALARIAPAAGGSGGGSGGSGDGTGTGTGTGTGSDGASGAGSSGADSSGGSTGTGTAAGTAGGDLVANGSFESGTSGWGAWQGSLSRTTMTGAPDGTAVVRVARASGTSYSLDDSWGGSPTVAQTAAGTTYSAAAFVRAASSAAAGRTVRLVLRERTPAGATVRETATTATLTTSFRRLAVVAEASASGNALGLRIEQSGARAGDAFLADRITLAAGNLVANGSFEAGTDGWGAWQGSVARAAVTGAPRGAAVARISHRSGSSFSLDDAWGGNAATVAATVRGRAYTAGAFVRAAGSASSRRTIRLVLRERTPAGATVRETAASLTLTSAFQRIAVAADATASRNTLGVRLEQSGAATGHAFEADGVSLGAA